MKDVKGDKETEGMSNGLSNMLSKAISSVTNMTADTLNDEQKLMMATLPTHKREESVVSVDFMDRLASGVAKNLTSKLK